MASLALKKPIYNSESVVSSGSLYFPFVQNWQFLNILLLFLCQH